MAIPNAAARSAVAATMRGLRTVGISMVVFHGQAWAEPLRLEQRVAPACVPAARELGPRLERALGGLVPNELEASVGIDAFGAGYRVTIALRDDEQGRGTTAIEAPTCEEAVDAAAVVLALAFGTLRRVEPTEPVSSLPVPAPAGSTPARGDRRAPLDSATSRGSERATRLTLATGVDRGTLPQPTLTLAAAAARSFGGLELAAVARYGLPIVEETVETAFSESRRRDFAGLELRACRGLGQVVRFSACAGAEVGAVRVRHALRGEAHAELDTDHLSPRLAGTLAALVVHRGRLVEPGLELAGAAAALGREGGAPWLSVRVAASAAIAF